MAELEIPLADARDRDPRLGANAAVRHRIRRAADVDVQSRRAGARPSGIGVPVAANQSSWGEFRIIDLIKRDACDVLMTDPHLEGGILAFKKAAALAHAGGLPIVNHAFSPATITMHAQLSVMGSTPGLILANQGHQDLLAGDVVTPLEYTDGRMRISTSPGLGLELDRARLEQYHDLFERQGFASAHAGQAPDQMITVPNQ